MIKFHDDPEPANDFSPPAWFYAERLAQARLHLLMTPPPIQSGNYQVEQINFATACAIICKASLKHGLTIHLRRYTGTVEPFDSLLENSPATINWQGKPVLLGEGDFAICTHPIPLLVEDDDPESYAPDPRPPCERYDIFLIRYKRETAEY